MSEEEAHAYFLKQLHAFFRVLLNVYAQRLQAIRSAAFGGSGAVAVLSNLHAACRSNQSGGCGNVEAVGAVAAGTDDFKDIHARFAFQCMVTHRSGAAGDFIGSFRRSALGRKRCQKGCILRCTCFTAHNLVDYVICFVIG